MDAIADIQQDISTAESPAESFATLSRDEKPDLFFSLPESMQERLVGDMNRGQLRAFVRLLDPDQATDVLGFADEPMREAVLEDLDANRREKIGFLLEFDPESAAGLMDLDYITVSVHHEFGDVARRVRRFEDRTDRVPTIFVLDGQTLLGELPGAALAMSDRESEAIAEYVEPVPHVRFDQSDADVLDVFRTNHESRVAVLDDDGEILGVIHADELLMLIEEEAAETLYEFTGVDEEEGVHDGPLVKVRHRYKWLIINLGTAFMAAAVVGLFESTIAALALLAAYMPVVAGMGGNAGTQSMAVTVRGLSLDQVSWATGRRVVVNEVIAGAINGAITGILVAIIASVFNQSPLLGAVIGVSMVVNLVIAGFFGAVIPMLLDTMDIDPATSATIFITTATDVLGFFVFLGLAQVVLL